MALGLERFHVLLLAVSPMAATKRKRRASHLEVRIEWQDDRAPQLHEDGVTPNDNEIVVTFRSGAMPIKNSMLDEWARRKAIRPVVAEDTVDEIASALDNVDLRDQLSRGVVQDYIREGFLPLFFEQDGEFSIVTEWMSKEIQLVNASLTGSCL